ncbi:aminotransferase class IV [Humidisolicoccus flavus]|uniref:aminotransferase class IV n=1 Tax=Humidisolicoccus flavus TaxID=3111414 RepID=UPI00324607A7
MTVPPLLALLDGSLHDISTPLLRADDLGVVRGDGVFDATLASREGIRDLDHHLTRLERSASILHLPRPDLEGFRRAVDALVAAWDWDAAAEIIVRMIHTRGQEGGGAPSSYVIASALATSAIAERESGVTVITLDRGHEGSGVHDLPWLLPGAKSLSYGINMAAKRYAQAQGADDALFVSPAGSLLEGPTSTLLLDLDGVLVSPKQEGILESVTLRQLIDDAESEGLEVALRDLDRDALREARGGWLLSSGRLAAAILSIDGVAMPKSPLHDALFRVLRVPAPPLA